MDGLVLNITLDNPGPKRSKVLKGGRWTERLKAKRISKRKERAEENTNVSKDVAYGVEMRPSKRPRTDSDRPNVPRLPATSTKHSTQIISSLFSYNPKTSSKESTIPSKSLKPSNAPVDTSTFEGLGLHPLLISHLSAKMNITQPTSVQRAALPSLLRTNERRDVFIQSQTGSGKTLSFLLPIIQDLLPLSTLSYIDRSMGTLAVIIAPTRELAKQISEVLETILNMRLRPLSDNPEAPSTDNPSTDNPSQRLTRWLVSGLLTGGGTRSHEKARLRRGIPILVSTPGRLLDHLQNTSAFNVGKCRWLVLDEADRLMDLGFEDTIRGILKGLDGRRNLALQAEEEGKGTDGFGWEWKERRNILCSATIREDVQKLAGVALNSPIVAKASDPASPSVPSHKDVRGSDAASDRKEKFTPPSQLAQNFVVVPLKLRLVALVALIRHLLSRDERARHGTKIIIFLSCTDSVDFHWTLLGGATMDEEAQNPSESISDSDGDSEGASGNVAHHNRIQVNSMLIPNTSIYRLHGSLPLHTRLASLKAFSSKPSASNQSSILLCTSVASRGLDLPLVRAVIQLDPPTEGGATEYVHRVGRTARVGMGGEAWTFVAPSEEGWVSWVEERMGDGKSISKLGNVRVETVLREGFGGKGTEYEARATEVQLSFERWVLRSPNHAAQARKAYLSHLRAYATHPSDEKHIFHIRHLHLGHLAKAFALREAPNTVAGKASKDARAVKIVPQRSQSKSSRPRPGSTDGKARAGGAEQRMTAVVRSQGRLNKKDGAMVTSDASEFQIASRDTLEHFIHS